METHKEVRDLEIKQGSYQKKYRELIEKSWIVLNPGYKLKKPNDNPDNTYKCVQAINLLKEIFRPEQKSDYEKIELKMSILNDKILSLIIKICKKLWLLGELNSEQKDFFNSNKIDQKNIKVLSSKETIKLRKKWEEYYLKGVPSNYPYLHQCNLCPGYKKGQYGGYNWSVFGESSIPHKTVPRDFLRTHYIREKTLILLWEECKFLAVELPKDIIKKLDYGGDLYVFPKDCSWTFVSTHEDVNFCASKPKKE